MRKSFQYRAYINRTTEQNALHWMHLCRTLYNAALEQKKVLWNQWKADISIRSHKQHRTDNPLVSELNKDLLALGINGQLPALKKAFPEYREIDAHTLLKVTDKLDNAFKAFFRRVKNGETPGFPRFKGQDRWDSFTMRESGWKLDGNRLHISRVGTFKLRLCRPIEGRIKTITVKRSSGKWYVSFSCDNVPAREYPEPVAPAVGIDMNVKNFCTDSTGAAVPHPKFLKASLGELARLQRAKARKKKGSRRCQALREKIAKVHEKAANQRKHFLHTLSYRYVRDNGIIAIEDLKIANITRKPKPKEDGLGHFLQNGAKRKAGLNRTILDAAWGTFFNFLHYKAEEAGRVVVEVNPRNTSRTCSRCGTIKEDLTLKDRTFCCPQCRLSIDRDHNAALNILRQVQLPTQAPILQSGIA